MKRACRKCGEYVPYKVVVDGKQHNLANRKFCLECSPFKAHNTSPTRPLSGLSMRNYRQWPKEAKAKLAKYTGERGKRIKRYLIELAGGACKKCGYPGVRCLRAMNFHHRDRSKKRFPMATHHLRSKSLKEVLTEFKKCDLLCVRCHMELEDGVA